MLVPAKCTRRSRSLFSVLLFLIVMDVGEGPSQPNHATLRNSVETIRIGDTVLLKIPSGDIRTIKLENNACERTLSRTVLV